MYMKGQQSLFLQTLEFAEDGDYYTYDGSYSPASYRNGYDPTYSCDFIGFRPALYVKL